VRERERLIENSFLLPTGCLPLARAQWFNGCCHQKCIIISLMCFSHISLRNFSLSLSLSLFRLTFSFGTAPRWLAGWQWGGA
jgi:hypothetical protein